jgi:ABC-type multidrug transport system fused ATPase/permease subunit
LWSFGLIHLLLELSFAYLLQLFLATLGLISIPPLEWGFLSLSLNKIIVLIIIVAFARAAVSFAQVVVGGGSTERFSHRIRSLLVENCLYASTVRSAETLTFFNQRIYTASMAIQSVQTLALQGILALGLLISLFLINIVPTILMFMVVVVISLPVRELNKRVKRSAKMHADTFSKIMLHLSNIFRNFLLIRLFNLQKREEQRLLGYLKTYSNVITQYYWFEGLASAVVPLIIVLNIIWLAFAQNTAATLDRSLAIPYLYLSFRFAQNLAPLVSNITRLSITATEFRHTFRWWLEQKSNPVRPPEDASGRQGVSPVNSAIGWSMSGVTFGYPGQPSLFKDFDLEVEAGSLVHIRGSSGVGKSTLVRLMVGEALPSSGSVKVRLDGELFPVSGVATRLRSHIGYSSTEPFLFEGTIYENITYGLQTLPEEPFLLESVARAECQFIFDLPEKLEHWIDELGQGLSTGQKQRLSLLRALLRKPRALILDEALSNVDMPTENRIMANLIRIKLECTILLISHREHSGLYSGSVLNLEELI